MTRANTSYAPVFSRGRGPVGRNAKLDAMVGDFTNAIERDPRNAALFNNRGLAYWMQGLREAAIADWTRTLELEPRHGGACVNRGAAYWKQGKYGLAVADLNRALEINPRWAEALYNRGNVHAERAENEEALADFTAALEIDPRYAEAYCSRGKVYARSGAIDAGIADFSRALAVNWRHFNAYHGRGLAFAAKGRAGAAIADFTKALEINPQAAAVWCNRGRALARKSDWPGAVADYTKALELRPRHGWTRYLRACAWGRLGEAANSAADLRAAIALDEAFRERAEQAGDFDPVRGAAEIVAILGAPPPRVSRGPTEARDSTPVAEASSPSAPTVAPVAEESRADEANTEELVSTFAAVAELRAEEISAETPVYRLPGRSAREFRSDDLPDEELPAETAQADSATPRQSRATSGASIPRRIWLGVAGAALARLGRCERAIALWSKFLEQHPDEPRALLARGRLRERKGELDAARADFTRAVDVGQLDAEAYKALIRVCRIRRERNTADAYMALGSWAFSRRADEHLAAGRTRAAIGDAAQAVELAPHLAGGYMFRALAYSRAGRRDAAVADLTRALKIEPELGAAYAARGATFIEQGRFQEAVEDLSKALLIDPRNEEAYLSRAIAHQRMENFAAAAADLTGFLDMVPRAAVAYYMRAMCRARMGAVAACADDLRRAFELDSDLRQQAKTAKWLDDARREPEIAAIIEK